MLYPDNGRKARLLPLLSKWLVMMLILGVVPLFPFPKPSTVWADSQITIDSHNDGQQVDPGIMIISGHYTNIYDIKLIVNGREQLDTHMNNLSGTETGTWHAELDTSQYHGEISLVARGLNSETRYGVTTSTKWINIDNPPASPPLVHIDRPFDGSHVDGQIPVTLSVYAINPIQTVEVRINGGSWSVAEAVYDHYEYIWDTETALNRTSSIEARATDVFGNIGRSLTAYVKNGEVVPQEIILDRQDRAIWIWEKAAYNLILNPGSRIALKTFADDTSTFNSESVTTFYLGVFPYGGVDILEEETDKVRDFMAWAHDNGYKVHACIAGGTVPPYFGSLTPYHELAIREMEKVINYNLSSSPHEQFDGVNVDIEPYILPDFRLQKPSVQLQYLDIMEQLVARRDTAGIALPFGPAIPRWFDSNDPAKDITWNGETKWLSEHIQDMSDYITIMDYRDTAEGSVGIIAHAQGEINYANLIGKPNSVVIGVETLDIANSGDPETITFREEGRVFMESELDKVYAWFNGNPAFGGIAMHHYDSIRWLPSAWGPGGTKWTVTPEDVTPPTSVSVEPAAAPFDYQSINLSYGRAFDDSDVEEYVIYRSIDPDFQPDTSNIAGQSRNLTYKDRGLLPDTTYYYKVAAKDISGNIGPASGTASATTTGTSLRPMIISEMDIVRDGTRSKVTLKVCDYETGEEIIARVHGRFTMNGGRYVELAPDANGVMFAHSEALPAAEGEVGFWPQRVLAGDYYWATAYDDPRTATVSWPIN
ncbi:Ig-like domain-containing protein [Paenibacillus bouchesdurhonensis]|uniref:Ig-like domain-containing protein n=1 Tax=Paenibacillus bouchesdurhonensis TaxID=1870990 RepID=UPI000DA615D4|nr:Ig-like domain-containing protein [Paenibacillus bouchesdurhonensis]